ncbi:conjugative transposon protein TraN [Sphingobacterium corticis]|uniref:Conjugative transposon protein TraN n=1 Tax=Sphingobacterium corticis TaxID=1812823 RepID=A0ABW5NIX2_9SPHI
MKKIIVNITIWWTALITGATAFAQRFTPIDLTPLPVELSTGFTTHIIFPHFIKAVDLGSTDIIAQKAQNTDNVLQVKAAKEHFNPTNLTVIGGDGTLYSFLVSYVARPDKLTISLKPKLESDSQIMISDTQVNESKLHENCKLITNQQFRRPMVKRAKYGAEVGMTNLYTHENQLYLRLDLQNSSTINYRVAQIRFFMSDNKLAKRTTIQQQELLPIYVDGDISKIAPRSHQLITFVLPLFTIPDGKHLRIQMLEENGGRNIEIKLRNKHLLRAINID